MKILLALILLVSCSTTESVVPIEKRKYDLCVDGNDKPTCDGFCYTDRVCTKRFLGICLKREIKLIDKFPMKIESKEICDKLLNMNFILNVRGDTI